VDVRAFTGGPTRSNPPLLLPPLRPAQSGPDQPLQAERRNPSIRQRRLCRCLHPLGQPLRIRGTFLLALSILPSCVLRARVVGACKKISKPKPHEFASMPNLTAIVAPISRLKNPFFAITTVRETKKRAFSTRVVALTKSCAGSYRVTSK